MIPFHNPIPIFGERRPDVIYIPRPGAYAVIVDAERRLAVIEMPQGFFLPGGGCDPDELPEDTLRREVMEECGYTLRSVRPIGRGVEFLYAAMEEVHYEIHSTFFFAEFDEKIIESVEENHTLIWVDPLSAIDRFRRESQAWAVRLVTEQM